MKYLAAYPAALRVQVERLVAQERLGEWLQKRYRTLYDIRTDRALYDYVIDLKNRSLRKGGATMRPSRT